MNCKIQQTDDVNRREYDFKRTFVQKNYLLVTLANINVSFAILFGQPHFWQHSYGWRGRILNVFFNNLNVNFLFIILLPSKWYTFSKLAMVLFQLHCMQFFQFEIILCVASCLIWFRCVSSCSCGETREFLSIPKVVFHQKVTCGGLSTVSLLFSCLLFLVHLAPNVQGISNSTDRSTHAYGWKGSEDIS